MKLQNRNYVITILALLVLLSSSMISTSIVAGHITEQAENTLEANTHYFDLETIKIAIFYDDTNELTRNTGESIAYSLALMSPDVYAVPVQSLDELDRSIEYNQFTIGIYVFQSTYENLIISSKTTEHRYSLTNFANLVEKYPDMYHIFAMGNTRQILNQLSPSLHVYGTNDEKVDAQQLYIYSLWTVADVLETNFSKEGQNFADDIRRASLQYFADNFNQIVSSNIQAGNPMGVESPETIALRTQAFYDKHPAKIEKIARDGYVVDPELMRDVDPITGEVRTEGYVLDVFPKASALPTDFILQALPEDSALRGPIGGIVDELLGLLFDLIGGQIGLSSDTVEALANAIFSIPDFIGAIKDPNASKIKDFLDTLKPMLPIPEDKYQYVDLIIDALFLLRGDAQDIISFIQSAIGLLVPEDWNIGGIKAADLISQVFELGAGVFDKISNGGNIVDIILSTLNEQIVANLTKTFMGDGLLFGLSPSEVTDAVSYITGLTGLIINLITSGSLTSLVEEYGPQLLTTALSQIGLSESNSKTIMLALSTVFVATGVIEGPTLEEVLISLVKEVSGVDIDTIEAKVNEIIGQISFAIDNGFNSISDFKNNVIDPLLGALNLNSNVEDAIKDIATILVTISRSSASLDSATNIASMIGSLLQGFGILNAEHIEIVQTMIKVITGVVTFVKNPPTLTSIINDLFDNIDLQNLMNEGITFLMGLFNPFLTQENLAGNLNQNTNGKQTNGIPIETAVASDAIAQISEAVNLVLQLVQNAQGNSIEGLMQTLLQAGVFVISQFVDTDLTAYVELFKSIFGQALGFTDSPPDLDQIMSILGSLVPSFQNEIKQLVGFILSIRDIFTGGFRTIMGQLTQWLTGQITSLIGSLTGQIDGVLGQETWDLFSIDIPIGIGGFSLFQIELSLGLSPGFEFNSEKFSDMIFDLVFKGVSIFTEGADAGTVLREAFSFFSIVPIFEAKFELKDFGTGESSFINFLLETLGLEISFSGYGFFKLMLFSFQNGVFNWDNFFKVVEWGFGFKITISKTLTLLDFLTGGAGGSLNSIGKYIGLDAISITIAFSIGFDIVKRAATANKPETGTMTLTFGIAFTVSLGIDILIAKLILKGTLEVVLTLLQDLVAPTPLQVFVSIKLTITVTIGFLFWDWDFDYMWSPSGYEPPLGKKINFGSPSDAKDNGALGADLDEDGLSDEYEKGTPGLNPNSADSDGDGLSDKYETQTLNTDPANKDSDFDLLDDNVELDIGTNPLAADSDFDGLNDYEESVIIGTNPLTLDTDEDGLDDYYEVNHAWNLTGITPSVKEVIIGGVPYVDRTDPLNPDTDGDGLWDGSEGERGIYYGPELYGDEEDLGYTPDPPLFFNGGYTHPLDNDTDDDSYWQLYDGSIAPVEIPFIMDMSDYAEITGFTVIFIDPLTGEPEPPRLVRTNPTNPDSDGDTGATAEDRTDPPFGFFLNSDGYELSRDPPTDPLDGDSDDDGLIDGLEGTLRPDSNHTNALNPDTDGDGLGDLQEFQLGTDPRSVDTDLDGVTDGDEFFVFHTNPFVADTDSDGLEDGEELYYYHSNPNIWDSDADGLNDYEEVWIYFSDPVDEDSDNDGLTDYDEIIIYYTDPFDEDTDDDGLFDGEEVLGLIYTSENGTEYTIFTDPNLWDTDNDSLTTIDQNGDMSQPMNDYQEWLLGTDPTKRDSDLDGLEDGWEMWLGKGLIPGLDPIPLDPTLNDTDGDLLLDGQELVIGNVSTLLNPYVGFVLISPYNTSAVNNDTDGDFLDDKFEMLWSFNPASNDTDGDTLSDYEEWTIYGTNVLKNDTDGDGLLDPEEIFGFDDSAVLGLNAIVFTDPNDPDTDNDLLPDGAEIYFYSKDPTNQDENNNNIVDGMEIDTDGDGLYDGEEYFVYRTIETAYGGGPQNPDSDSDGLFDGLEVYEVGTDAGLWDTDLDTYSDGLEYYCGTNPTDNNTTPEEIGACFEGLVRIAVLSPAPTIYNTNQIPVIVFDSEGVVDDMEYRYKLSNETDWSSSVPMIESAQVNYWEGAYLALPSASGQYDLEITADTIDGDTITRKVTFSLDINLDGLKILSPKSQTYDFNEFQDPKLPIEVEAGIEYTSLKFRIKDNDGNLVKENTTLEFKFGDVYHLPGEFTFPDEDGATTYALEVFGTKTNGEELLITSVFKIKTPTLAENLIVVGAPIAAVATVVVAGKAGLFKNPFKKGGNN